MHVLQDNVNAIFQALLIYINVHNIARVLIAQRIPIYGPGTINQIIAIKRTKLSHQYGNLEPTIRCI